MRNSAEPFPSSANSTPQMEVRQTAAVRPPEVDQRISLSDSTVQP
jgi:hypothetical protein